MKNHPHQVSAIILAGGQGRRFNYQDKGLLPWQGKPLVRHVIDRLMPQVNQLIINANQYLDQYRALGFVVCQDQLNDFQGPLAGIQAALPLAEHPLVLISPCDTVLLPDDLVNRLIAALMTHGADLAYPSCADRAHYLPVLLKATLAPRLNTYLQGRDRSMKGWYKSLNAIAVPFSSDSAAFSNFNHPEDLTG